MPVCNVIRWSRWLVPVDIVPIACLFSPLPHCKARKRILFSLSLRLRSLTPVYHFAHTTFASFNVAPSCVMRAHCPLLPLRLDQVVEGLVDLSSSLSVLDRWSTSIAVCFSAFILLSKLLLPMFFTTQLRAFYSVNVAVNRLFLERCQICSVLRVKNVF